ncbi:ABC transporter, ATP-binding protein [Thermococcus sp. 2319x1]|uniref:ATP-binding cassette domain-containing protein n=1 Tax=Thermococcus sp. 2319x1 TaxID=1674923 RepID=UPI00073A5383|nr:ATP-binding cassette domain-containing protein [Thermococcus sp. 2319x1]ALV62336.1 ABC transporter, ATP-binding protein [Thermococcus sp. 2319x1]
MLKVSNLVAGYGKTPIIGPISFRVERGNAIILYGPNGTGKTTLLKTLATLLRPLDGKMELNGRPIHRVKNKIFLLDERVNLPKSLRAIEYMKVISALYGVFSEDYSDLLKRFGIDPSTLISHLSQGQQRRLQLATTLSAKSAELFLIDDPTVGLDDYSVEILIPWLVEQLRRMEKIVVITTRTESLIELLGKDAKVINVVKYSKTLPKIE